MTGRPFNTSSVTKSSGDEVLEPGHLGALVGEFVREVRRDHVAREYRRVAAADRALDLDRLVHQVGAPLAAAKPSLSLTGQSPPPAAHPGAPAGCAWQFLARLL